MKREIVIPDFHPATEGHFPSQPIVPGAVLLAEVAAALDLDSAGLKLRDAKFVRPVLPGSYLHLAATPVEGGLKFELSLADGTLAVSGTMLHDR